MHFPRDDRLTEGQINLGSGWLQSRDHLLCCSYRLFSQAWWAPGVLASIKGVKSLLTTANSTEYFFRPFAGSTSLVVPIGFTRKDFVNVLISWRVLQGSDSWPFATHLGMNLFRESDSEGQLHGPSCNKFCCLLSVETVFFLNLALSHG